MSELNNTAQRQFEHVWSAIGDIRARIIALEKTAAPAPETERQSAPYDPLLMAYERRRKDGRYEGRKEVPREMLAWCENGHALGPANNFFRDRIIYLLARC